MPWSSRLFSPRKSPPRRTEYSLSALSPAPAPVARLAAPAVRHTTTQAFRNTIPIRMLLLICQICQATVASRRETSESVSRGVHSRISRRDRRERKTHVHAETDQQNIRLCERKRFPVHLQIIAPVPAGLHDSFVRMSIATLHDMRDFVSQNVCQQGLYSAVSGGPP